MAKHRAISAVDNPNSRTAQKHARLRASLRARFRLLDNTSSLASS
jgi:hypothetical protein